MSLKINPRIRHPQYEKYFPRWKAVNDICDGENVHEYIFDIHPEDVSEENKARNRSFKQRAVFAAIAGYTARGLTGIVFSKWPTLKVPPQLDYMKDSADGSGVSIYQQSQEALRDVVRVGRCGLFVDFPANQSDASQSDIQSGNLFAPIMKINAEQILNWNTTRQGGRTKLSLVVIYDQIRMESDEGFVFTSVDVIYELRLVDGIYVFREWRTSVVGGGAWSMVDEVVPVDGEGNPWDEIPFLFIGSNDNTPDVDPPPMFDIVRVNIGHVNNSAIYEDSVYITGQPQPWMSGIDFDYVQQAQENGMYYGAPVMIPVPSGETFGISQAQPNTMAREAMQEKVETMVGLGAMFIQPGSAAKTAAQSLGEQMVQHSVLSLIASNVSEAYTEALKWAARFMAAPEEECQYTVQQKFVDPEASPQMLQQMIAGFLQGAIPLADYHRWMQRNQLSDEEQSTEDFSESLTARPSPDLDN
jgi:hypothetical protein